MEAIGLQSRQQIPYGNDNKKSKGNYNYSPSFLTSSL